MNSVTTPPVQRQDADRQENSAPANAQRRERDDFAVRGHASKPRSTPISTAMGSVNVKTAGKMHRKSSKIWAPEPL